MKYEKNQRGHGVTGGTARSRIIALGRVLSVVLIVAGLVLLVMAIEKANESKYVSEHSGQRVELPDEKRPTTEYNGSKYMLKEGLETTLVIGIDTFEEDVTEGEIGNYHQADLLYLIVADKTNKTYATIHINRDTMTMVKVLTSNGKTVRDKEQQIALAYAYGDTYPIQSRNTVDAVSRLFNGITIDHYVSATMDCVSVLNDAVDGVTLEVMDDIDELKAGDTVTLHGDQALRYVRARKSVTTDPTNERRMERQTQFIKEFQKLFRQKAEESSAFTLDTLNDITGYMHSDCTVEQLSGIVNTVIGYDHLGEFKLEGEITSNGKLAEFRADPDKLAELYLRIFCDKID